MSVYALRDPRTGAVRYVGRSRDPHRRLRTHVLHPHSASLVEWIGELTADGLSPELEILGTGSEASWVQRLKPDLNILPGVAIERPDEPNDIALTVRLPAELYLAAKAAADADQRSLNLFIVRAVAKASGALPELVDHKKR